MIQFVTVNFNTQDFTEHLIRSINKFVPDAVITVFDNSDKVPFTNTFTNVSVLDNTKSQLIDFDKFIKKYPMRMRSDGHWNKWASAKHCYTIQHCMDIFDDGFFLLDSDCLLKKDCSALVTTQHAYAGQVILQDNNIERVCPYVCYINTKMCKERGLKFFDDKWMHGLHTGIGDKYDTGAAFHIHTKDQPRLLIDVEEYMVHYGHASWVSSLHNKNRKKEDFFKKYEELWKTEN